jgi:hypothetical protein
MKNSTKSVILASLLLMQTSAFAGNYYVDLIESVQYEVDQILVFHPELDRDLVIKLSIKNLMSNSLIREDKTMAEAIVGGVVSAVVGSVVSHVLASRPSTPSPSPSPTPRPNPHNPSRGNNGSDPAPVAHPAANP